MKNVPTPTFSSLHFSVFELNTEIDFGNVSIHFDYGKIGTVLRALLSLRVRLIKLCRKYI